MIEKNDALYKDLEAIKQIAIVPTMLDVVCRITGMGFAAVARVTDDRWLACSVKDNVNFGLAEGGELKVETTICNEIRDSRKEVVFEHASQNEQFRDHHTPKMYGLESYISFPIILKNGDFFGTLCAIDSKPASVNRPEVLGMFKLFSELISFHLQSIDLVNRSQNAITESSKKINDTTTENQLYKQISGHNIQEQVRKISLFSDVLTGDTNAEDMPKIKKTAARIHAISKELSSMVGYVNKYSTINNTNEAYEIVNLNDLLQEVETDLSAELKAQNITLQYNELPLLQGIRLQLKELFFYLLTHALVFSNEQISASVKVYMGNLKDEDVKGLLPQEEGLNYCEIIVEEKGIGVDDYQLENVFDIFLHLSEKKASQKYGAGLAYCRKIVQNHNGIITAQHLPNNTGVAFHIILPVNPISN